MSKLIAKCVCQYYSRLPFYFSTYINLVSDDEDESSVSAVFDVQNSPSPPPYSPLSQPEDKEQYVIFI